MFLDKNGSDDNHPVFISVQDGVCTPPEITVTPDDDQLLGSSCGMSFDFTADPGMVGESPAIVGAWNILSGIGTIDSSGHYVVDPQPIGTYSVTIRVINSCYMIDSYSFDVIFTDDNDVPYFTNCPHNFAPLDWFVVPVGCTLSYPIYFEDSDTCDDLTVEILSIEYYGDTPFLGSVTLEDDVVVVNTTETDDDIQIRIELLLQDGVGSSDTCELGYDIGGFHCGDVNHLVPVDIDDVVFLLNYVFLSGFAPEPYSIGDVDCSGDVDVDDVVYLVMYIFGGGHPPCDTDGDAVPDC